MKVIPALLLVACAGKAPSTPPPATPPPAPAAESVTLTVRGLPLPGAPADGVYMDYLAYDAAHHRVWVPAGNTGSVDVIDVPGDKIQRIEGFLTAEMERHGKKRIVGPSSATVAGAFVYVGNRADNSICAIDAVSLKVGACVKLDAMPDGIAYVAATKEVWVTTPRVKAMVVLDVSDPKALKVKQKMTYDGEPEGFAVDDARGVFYTNLEDTDKTLAIDIKTKAITHTWLPACGEDGPKGLALDHAANLLLVACADRIEALDAGHDGAVLSKLDTGDGVDAIDYVEARHEAYAGAAKAAKLTVARLDAKGQLSPVATVDTAQGARNPVATEGGVAYLTDTPEGKILMVTPVSSPPSP